MSNVYSDSSLDIKKLLDTNSYSVILDTNILLNLYRVSPDYAELCIKCLQEIEEYIVLPSTVHHEFKKHNRELYSIRKKALSSIIRDIAENISNQKNKTHGLYKDLQRRNFPNTDELLDEIDSLYDKICSKLKEYDETHNEINFLNDLWDKDVPFEIVSRIKDNYRVLPALSAEEIFDICDDGARRYKSKTPPGFKDAKEKDGVRKYADLIWWEEVIKYANKFRKNIILVTDDVKEDWWNQDEKGNLFFHPCLIEEFNKKTTFIKPNGSESKVRVQPFTSIDFYKCISDYYNIESIGALELSLKISEDSYIEAIDEKIRKYIIDTLRYSNDFFIYTSPVSRSGSKVFDEWEVSIENRIDHELIEIVDGKAVYRVDYKVTMTGDSHDILGTNDDTQEPILSPPTTRTADGLISIYVYRSVFKGMNFDTDFQYEKFDIYASDLLYNGECSHCGCKINFDNYGVNGLCGNCAYLSFIP